MLKKLGITAIAVSTLALTGCQSDFEKKFSEVLIDEQMGTSEQIECFAAKVDDIFPSNVKEGLVKAFNEEGATGATFERFLKDTGLHRDKAIESSFVIAAKTCGLEKK